MSTPKITPAILDKKTEDNATDGENREQNDTVNREDDRPMIVYRQTFVDANGVQQTKEHGPMPVEDWAAYEKEHKL